MSVAQVRFDTLHHAYLLTGDRERAISEILVFLERVRGIDIRRSPDVLVERHATFSIDEARKVQTTVLRKPLSGRRIYVISFNRATVEAQNALLKTLEEPSETNFFIIVPTKDTLIPTVLSRLMYAGHAQGIFQQKDADAFLSADMPERMKLIKPFLSGDEGSDMRAQVADFLRTLEQRLFEVLKQKSVGVPPEVFQTLSKMQDYITDSASSVKLILEHLSLALPRIRK